MLVMKAMSLELVKGTIDEVDQVVHIDWIMPRYLNKENIQILVNRMQHWEDKMTEVIAIVENSGQELLTE
jgi:26S proteasome regulatory subunit N9